MSPLFLQPLHVGRPNIGNRKQLNKYFNEILDNKWLTNNGPFVQKFEKRIEQYLGVKHCISVCNATTGLEVAIKALDITGEIIVPSFTFIASAHSAKWNNVTPVFCDVSSSTHNINVDKIEELISPDTTGIMGVHLWGKPCDIYNIKKLARKHKLSVIFDAAHAFGCSYNGKMIGNFGDAEVFSFHATKFLNTFEGGAITTNNDRLAKRLRLMTNFGFEGIDNVIDIGTNGKMNEVSAAMGLSGMDSIDKFIKVNYKNYRDYQKYLTGIPGVSLIEYNNGDKYNYQYIVLEVDDKRDELVDILQKENIFARKYFYPGCHNAKPYKHLKFYLPETNKVIKKVMVLPTGTSIGTKDIKQICDLIRSKMEET